MGIVDTAAHCEGCRVRDEIIYSLRAENDALRNFDISLPKITDDLVDQFYPWLIADDPHYKYTWNQAAVDFACALKEAAMRGEGE